MSVAKDSRSIALAAQQDSKAMKTIAVLTLFFLPASLVAVSLTPPSYPVSTKTQTTEQNVSSDHLQRGPFRFPTRWSDRV